MPLVKELCVRCHDEYRVKPWAKQPKKERTWARGRMACVALLDLRCKGQPDLEHEGCRRYIRVDGSIPEFCHFILEQMVNQPDSG